MTRRNVELVLLLVAAPVVALLFAMIAINQGQSLDMTTLGVPAAIFVAFVIAHLAVRKFAANATRPCCPSRSRCPESASRSSPAWRPTWPSAR